MPDDTHDMGLFTLLVDGIAQRLAVDGQRLVVPAVMVVPALQRSIELRGVDADKEALWLAVRIGFLDGHYAAFEEREE